MRRFLWLLVACSLAVGASAQDVIRGQMTAAFGWVKQPDGTKKSVKGMKFDYTLRRVDAGVIDRNGRVHVPFPKLNTNLGAWSKTFVPPQRRGGPPSGGIGTDAADAVIYNAINPAHPTGTTGYAYLDPNEFFDPSSLDDVTIDAPGAGKTWSRLFFGLHVEQTTQQIIWRIRVFNTSTDNPPGQMDFIDELADFGNYWTPPVGDFVGEISGISQAGINVPDTDCFVAVQWREPDPSGEGAFVANMYNLYYVAAPPSVGSSADTWYYDSDPLDGIYELTEIDQFQSPNHGNLALKAYANTSSQSGTGLPSSVTTTHGTYLSGNFISLWFDDTNTYNVKESLIGARVDPNVGITIDSAMPTTSPLSLRVVVNATADAQEATQKIDIWRFGGGSPGWVALDSRPMFPGVPLVTDVLYGGAIPLNQFIDPSGTARLRLRYFRNPAGSRSPMIVHVNKVNWIVNY